MRYPKWLEVMAPFKVKTEIQIDDDGNVTATASAVSIYDPIGVLPTDMTTYSTTAHARCHPNDEYNRSYGVRLASNRARRKFYIYMANRINERLGQLDDYLRIIHNKALALNAEHDVLLLEQMDIKELPENN